MLGEALDCRGRGCGTLIHSPLRPGDTREPSNGKKKEASSKITHRRLPRVKPIRTGAAVYRDDAHQSKKKELASTFAISVTKSLIQQKWTIAMPSLRCIQSGNPGWRRVVRWDHVRIIPPEASPHSALLPKACIATYQLPLLFIASPLYCPPAPASRYITTFWLTNSEQAFPIPAAPAAPASTYPIRLTG